MIDNRTLFAENADGQIPVVVKGLGDYSIRRGVDPAKPFLYAQDQTTGAQVPVVFVQGDSGGGGGGISDAALGDYISGLEMQWDSGTGLTVKTGAAYIESVGKVVDVAANITKSGLTLSNSIWYHVYLYLNSGVPDIEIVTDAPAAPYKGMARSKTADSSRRYIGSVKTGASGGIIKFRHLVKTNSIRYYSAYSNQAVLSLGKGTTPTTVNVSPFVPLTSIIAQGFMLNASTDQAVYMTNSDVGSDATTAPLAFIQANGVVIGEILLDANQTLIYQYAAAPAGNGFFINVTGYDYLR